MKKILRFVPILLSAVCVTMLCSCDDDDYDNDIAITTSQLPVQAQVFISSYFPTASVGSAQKDGDGGYEVTLTDGTDIDFNAAGEWTDVDAAAGMTIPSGFYPLSIDTYVNENLGGTGINEISKDFGGYEVELVTGTDLYFSADGSFIGYEPD